MILNVQMASIQLMATAINVLLVVRSAKLGTNAQNVMLFMRTKKVSAEMISVKRNNT